MWDYKTNQKSDGVLMESLHIVQQKSDRAGFVLLSVTSTALSYYGQWPSVNLQASYNGETVLGSKFNANKNANRWYNDTQSIYIPSAWIGKTIRINGQLQWWDIALDAERASSVYVGVNGSIKDGTVNLNGVEGAIYIKSNGAWKEGG